MKLFKKENGSVLVYVLMISAVLMITIPTVLMTNSNSAITDKTNVEQYSIRRLVVSGMQAILRYPGTPTDQLTYLFNHNYGETTFQLPDGRDIVYRQYVAVNENDDITGIVEPEDFDDALPYYVIVSATLGNQSYSIHRLFPGVSPTPTIISVSSNPTTQNAGVEQVTAVTVQTENISDNTSVTVELIKNGTTDYVVTGDGNINNNQAIVSLTVPSSATSGSYYFNVTINDLTHSTTVYTISDSTINTVSSSPTTQNVGVAQVTEVTIQTSNISDNTSVTVELMKNGTTSSVATGNGSISSNQAIVALTVPISATSGSYFFKVTINTLTHNSTGYTILDLLQTIDSVSSYPTTQNVGVVQVTAVTVQTTNIPNGTSVTVDLIKDGTTDPVVTGSGTISSNQAIVALIVPTSAASGSYFIKVTINHLTHSSTGYTILDASAAPVSGGQALNYDSNGNLVIYTQEQMSSDSFTTITTTGILFIPANFDIQTTNGTPIIYSAAQGIYIGADITTKASSSNITLRACSGPIIINGATFDTSTGANNIFMQAGTSISANGTTFITKNSGSTNLTANEYLDVTNGIFSTGSINFTAAFNNTSYIITTGADFNRTTPSKTADPSNPITCP